jgi:hypothetical protein
MMTQLTPHQQAMQNMHRMSFEMAKGNCIEGSFRRLNLIELTVEIFIAEEEGNRLCLFVTANVEDDIHYDCVDLMRNPEMFDIWDSGNREYDLSEIDDLVVGYLECLKQTA